MTDIYTYDDVIEAATRANLSEEELLRLNKFIIGELKEVRAREARRTVASLRAGDTVEVGTGLRGDAYLGQRAEVVKVNRTRVVCRFEGELANVTIPASVLTKVTA